MTDPPPACGLFDRDPNFEVRYKRQRIAKGRCEMPDS